MKVGLLLFGVCLALGCSSPSQRKGYWQDVNSIHPEAIAYQVKGAELRRYCNDSNLDSMTRVYISYLDTALSIDSKYELARSERARSYLVLKQKDKAIDDYKTLIHLNDANPYPKIMLASIYMEEGDSVQGVEWLSQGLGALKQEMELYPDSSKLYITYIAILQKFGRVAEAKVLLQKMPKGEEVYKDILEGS